MLDHRAPRLSLASALALALAAAATGCHCHCGPDGSDAGTDAAGPGTDAVGPGSDASPCAVACSGATPVCDPATGTCVACLAAADCDDADPCTTDACDTATTTCGYSWTPGAACNPVWAARAPTSTPPGLIWPATAYDEANDRTILFGGMRSDLSLSGETWAWDGADWTLLTPAMSPSARFVHGMVYDSGRGVVVLFGGLPDAFSTSGLSDTWEWDGTNWSDAAPAASPPGRGVGGNLAYDRDRAVTVLYGGGSQPGATVYDDTWEYDGSTWNEVTSIVTVPPARVAGCLAFDEAAGNTLLFGGGTWGPFFDDTFTFDGTDWSALSPATSPAPPRQSLRCVWDAWRNRVVAFGGDPTNTGSWLADSWDWDGTSWSDTTSAGPPTSCCHGMSYDRARRETVVFTAQGETWVLELP